VDAAALKTRQAKSSIPVYLGQAPIWQVDDENWQDLSGATFVIKSIDEMRSKLGYSVPESGAFAADQSLSMVAKYHNDVEQTMPVIMVNNKALITATSTARTSVDFVNGVAKIAGRNTVLSSVKLSNGSGTDYVKDTDYTIAYDEKGQNVIINSSTLTTASVDRDVVTPETITFNKDTYDEIDYIPQNTGDIPANISAPLWDKQTDSGGNTVMAKLAAIAEAPVDKHYYVQAFGQLESGTRSGAITEKADYNSAKLKACWPFVKINSYIYPVSLVFSARKETVDKRNDGIPYESASNEIVPIEALCDKSGNAIKQLEEEADSLNAAGIATMAFTTNMKWNTWGVCMSNYSDTNRDNIPPNKLNDAAVQMMDFICNDFELQYGDIVHKPMSIRTANDIVQSYGQRLDAFVSSGMLIAGRISFEPSENSTADLANGQFTYTIEETNTPPAKAIIANVTYDSDSLDKFFESMGEEE
jgi:hypothetical protein